MSVQIHDVHAHSDDTILLAWDAVHSSVTSMEYLRKSRFFLEYAGFVERKLMNHKRGR